MKPPSREALFTSLVAGQLAAVAMLVTIVIAHVIVQRGAPLFPLQVMTALTAGEDALVSPTPRTVLPGLIAHQLGLTLVWSRAFGLVVGYATGRVRLSRALALGGVVGVISELTDVYLLMPHFQRQVNGRNLWAEHVPLSVDWLAHLVFGLALGLFFWRWQSPGAAARADVGKAST